MQQREIRLLRWFQRHREHAPLKYFTMLISRNPLRDITLIVPLFAFLALPSHGFEVVWICLIGALAEQIAEIASGERRLPTEIDPSLCPLSRQSRSLISSESFRSSMIFGYLASLGRDHSVYVVCCASVPFIIGLSRLLGSSHFPHQVFWGCISGFSISPLWTLLRNALFRNGKVPLAFNVLASFALGGALLLLTTLSIENNEHKYIGVRRKEYVDVLRSIIEGEATNSGSGTGADDASLPLGYRGRTGRVGRQKRDSFVNMLRGMERRRRRAGVD